MIEFIGGIVLIDIVLIPFLIWFVILDYRWKIIIEKLLLDIEQELEKYLKLQSRLRG